jgi:soluble lytic murein transglycosylase-like protein
MARAMMFVGGLACGFLLATAVIASHADDVNAEVLAAATAAHKDPVALAGAVASTGVDPWTYLQTTPGELDPPPAHANFPGQSYTSQSSPRVDCIIHYESRGDARAVNPRSGAAGLGQFLASTWRSTPQGRAGLSVFNAEANRAAVGWMLSAGRAREFAVVAAGLC